MKKLYYLLLSLFVATGFAACSQEDSEIAPNDEHADEVLVNLNIGTEITADYSPLTRAGSTDDLLGIQVDRINSNGTTEEHFAYGLFDRLEGISVYLKKEYTYKITATLVKDGKNKLYNSGNGSYYPFHCSSSSGNVNCNNLFNYSTYYFNTLNNSKATLKGSSSAITNYPELDRLYGEVTNIKPMVGGTIDLDLKRVSFGLKYEVSELDEGTLNVKIEKINTNAKTFVNVTGVENDYKSETAYYTFTDMTTAYDRADTYYESFLVTVSHKHDIIGVTESLGSVEVKIYRNKLNNIRINLKTVAGEETRSVDSLSPSMVSVDYEDIINTE